jgi:aryl-alcohol dehydrogenase-like predicted oxidoreductase
VGGVALERRSFGRTGLDVSALGMGCGRLGSPRADPFGANGRRAVNAALDSGIDFFDTADSYGRGFSERMLGRAIARWKGRVTVATKCGLLKTPAALGRVANAQLRPRDSSDRVQPRRLAEETFRSLTSRRCFDPGYIRRAAEASLRRLHTDHLDVLLLHSPWSAVLVAGDFVEVLERLRAEGKIRFWGVSARSEEDALLAMGLPGIDCIEIELNLCHTAPTDRVIPEASKVGVAVIARQPFGSGNILARAASLDPVLDSGRAVDVDDRSPAGLIRYSLQFAMGVPGVSTVIPGMTRPEHVWANVGAATSPPVPDEEIDGVRRRICAE